MASSDDALHANAPFDDRAQPKSCCPRPHQERIIVCAALKARSRSAEAGERESTFRFPTSAPFESSVTLSCPGQPLIRRTTQLRDERRAHGTPRCTAGQTIEDHRSELASRRNRARAQKVSARQRRTEFRPSQVPCTNLVREQSTHLQSEVRPLSRARCRMQSREGEEREPFAISSRSRPSSKCRRVFSSVLVTILPQ